MTTLLAKPSTTFVKTPGPPAPAQTCGAVVKFVAMVMISVPKRSPVAGLTGRLNPIGHPPKIVQNTAGGGISGTKSVI